MSIIKCFWKHAIYQGHNLFLAFNLNVSLEKIFIWSQTLNHIKGKKCTCLYKILLISMKLDAVRAISNIL